LDNLGVAYGDLGDFHKMKELLERALLIEERHYGSEHPQVAAILTDLGVVYGALGDAHKGKEVIERALLIKERHYGPDHPQIA
jgi:tetratricopeptide (TPR) repeat protein